MKMCVPDIQKDFVVAFKFTLVFLFALTYLYSAISIQIGGSAVINAQVFKGVKTKGNWVVFGRNPT